MRPSENSLTITPAREIIVVRQKAAVKLLPPFTYMPRILKSIEQRFWQFVVKHSECWEWTGATHPAGYGVIGRGKRGTGNARASHVSWKIHTGEDVPAGKMILHLCDNPPCCNPSHLRLGTHQDNMDDMRNKQRQNHPPRYAIDNVNGLLTDSEVDNLRLEALKVPPRRYGRIEFWQTLSKKYGIKPKYAQQLATNKSRIQRSI